MNTSTDTPPYAQTEPPRKSRRLWWILGILAIAAILLGTCVKGGMDLFKSVAARQQATYDLARQFLSEGLPEADDPIFSKRANVTPEALAKLQSMMDQFGAISNYSDAVCTLTTAANTNRDASGTFGQCYMSAVSEHSPLNISVRWVREGEDWKVLAFNLNYSDMTVLLEKAKQSDLPSPAADAASDDSEPE